MGKEKEAIIQRPYREEEREKEEKEEVGNDYLK
jgi:hypothetical protein